MVTTLGHTSQKVGAVLSAVSMSTTSGHITPKKSRSSAVNGAVSCQNMATTSGHTPQNVGAMK